MGPKPRFRMHMPYDITSSEQPAHLCVSQRISNGEVTDNEWDPSVYVDFESKKPLECMTKIALNRHWHHWAFPLRTARGQTQTHNPSTPSPLRRAPK